MQHQNGAHLVNVQLFTSQADTASFACVSSGMLPGYVAGYYSYEECHVDLAKLTSFARARLIVATATSIDTQVSLSGHVQQVM